MQDLESKILEAMSSNTLSVEEKKFILKLLEEREEYRKYNKMFKFNPYPFQSKFFEAGLKHRFRFLCAANR